MNKATILPLIDGDISTAWNIGFARSLSEWHNFINNGGRLDVTFREVKLEAGWLQNEIEAARREIEALPNGLRDETPVRRAQFRDEKPVRESDTEADVGLSGSGLPDHRTSYP